MWRKIALIVLIFSCISWISYVSFDIVSKENAVNYFELFDVENEIIFALHYPKEVDWKKHKVYTTSDNKRVLDPIIKSVSTGTSIYFSSKRPLILLRKSNNWEYSQVKQIFQNGIYNLKSNGLKKFDYGDYKVEFNKNQLLIHQLNNFNLHHFETLKLDSKSSFSKIYMVNDTVLFEDTYCRKGLSILYQKKRLEVPITNQIDDKELFSNHIPLNFDNYIFYSKERLERSDSLFSNSILKKSVKNGIVILTKNGNKVCLFDYEENSNPIQTMNEYYGVLESNENNSQFDSISFSEHLKTKNSVLYIHQNNGMAIISNNKTYFDEILTELSIGNILSSNKERMELLFENLPKKVSKRLYDNNGVSAESSTGKIHMTTCVSYEENDNELDDLQTKDYFAMNPNVRIIDFNSFEDRGNVVFMTNGGIIGFLNGKKEWQVDFEQAPIRMNTHQKTHKVIVELMDSVMIFDQFGNTEFVLPITGQQVFKFFAKDFEFSIGLVDEDKLKFISKSKGLYKTMKFNSNIDQFAIIEEIGKAYIICQNELIELNLDNFITKKLFKVPEGYKIFEAHKGIIIIKQNGNTINILNDSGGFTGISYPNLKIHKAITAFGKSSILISSLNRIYLINSDGQLVWSKIVDLNEISQISTGMNKENKSIMALFDAIENKMLLLNFFGNEYYVEKMHAAKAIKITSFGKEKYSITTYLNNYTIQYNK